MNHIRPMELADTSRAAEIHVFGWRKAYRGIVSDEILFKRMSVAKSTERFADRVRDNAFESYVYDDGIVKGFMTIGPCHDKTMEDFFELWGIYIDPFMQGRGIGAQMVDFCETAARQRGYKKISLWVLEDNAAARGFYEKMGYAPDGARQFLDGLGVWEVRYFKGL